MVVDRKINELLAKMIKGWSRGSGVLFAEPFSRDAHFVAFDGSVHYGPEEIAAFHQKAFDSVLKGTHLDLILTDTKQVDEKIWLVFAKGWHRSSDARHNQSTSESVNIFVCRVNQTNSEVLAFQNTRVRPIMDQTSADLWRAFDISWESRNVNKQ